MIGAYLCFVGGFARPAARSWFRQGYCTAKDDCSAVLVVLVEIRCMGLGPFKVFRYMIFFWRCYFGPTVGGSPIMLS